MIKKCGENVCKGLESRQALSRAWIRVGTKTSSKVFYWPFCTITKDATAFDSNPMHDVLLSNDTRYSDCCSVEREFTDLPPDRSEEHTSELQSH